VGKVNWRLTLEFAWRNDDEHCPGTGEWEDVEDLHVTTLHFKDGEKAKAAYREARFALVRNWSKGNPPQVRTNFAKRHEIAVWDSDGGELNHSLALMRIVEFIKIEKLHER